MYILKIGSGDRKSDLIVSTLETIFTDYFENLCYIYKPATIEPVYVITDHKDVAHTIIAKMNAEEIKDALSFMTNTIKGNQLAGNIGLVRNYRLL